MGRSRLEPRARLRGGPEAARHSRQTWRSRPRATAHGAARSRPLTSSIRHRPGGQHRLERRRERERTGLARPRSAGRAAAERRVDPHVGPVRVRRNRDRRPSSAGRSSSPAIAPIRPPARFEHAPQDRRPAHTRRARGPRARRRQPPDTRDWPRATSRDPCRRRSRRGCPRLGRPAGRGGRTRPQLPSGRPRIRDAVVGGDRRGAGAGHELAAPAPDWRRRARSATGRTPPGVSSTANAASRPSHGRMPVSKSAELEPPPTIAVTRLIAAAYASG